MQLFALVSAILHLPPSVPLNVFYNLELIMQTVGLTVSPCPSLACLLLWFFSKGGTKWANFSKSNV